MIITAKWIPVEGAIGVEVMPEEEKAEAGANKGDGGLGAEGNHSKMRAWKFRSRSQR